MKDTNEILNKINLDIEHRPELKKYYDLWNRCETKILPIYSCYTDYFYEEDSVMKKLYIYLGLDKNIFNKLGHLFLVISYDKFSLNNGIYLNRCFTSTHLNKVHDYVVLSISDVNDINNTVSILLKEDTISNDLVYNYLTNSDALIKYLNTKDSNEAATTAFISNTTPLAIGSSTGSLFYHNNNTVTTTGTYSKDA